MQVSCKMIQTQGLDQLWYGSVIGNVHGLLMDTLQHLGAAGEDIIYIHVITWVTYIPELWFNSHNTSLKQKLFFILEIRKNET